MKVNMTPNPLDVVTIHASQGDTEARQWEFELHNNGELIDTSDVKEQLVFKAYKGGTEQLLPENGSTPTTSPFLGDIKYPQGLLTDQEFTYRQSPTEEDGLAKVTDIKGNTLVWNQLVQNGNFATANGWASSSSTNMTIAGASNNRLLFSTSSAIAAIMNTKVSFPKNHKLLFKLSTDLSNLLKIRLYTRDWVTLLSPTELTKSGNFQYLVINPLSDDVGILYIIPSVDDNVQHYVSNVQVFDLTMLGIDNLTNNEVLEWFATFYPLPYYAYNQGSLLSFNGTGIKTVGKNQSQLVSMSTVSGGYINASSGEIATVKKGITYTLSFDNLTPSTANIVARIQVNGTWVRQGEKNLVANSRWSLTFTAIDDGALGLSAGLGSQYSEVKVFDNIQLEFGSANTEYEPYIETITELPISDYFPNGMKSAGSVYDELTETKAITRIGSVDLGTLTWNYNSTYNAFSSTGIANIAKGASNSQVANTRSIYDSVSLSTLLDTEPTKNGLAINSYGNIWVRNTSYNDATAFKTAMNGIPLYFEISAYQETSFSTASLVTENAEIPLSNEDGILIGKCTEQLSENPGFIDAKIKLSDSDGTCYSNKIQLHIERSPQ